MGKVPKPKVVRVNLASVPRKNYGEKRPASQVKQVTFHHIVGDAAAAIAEMKKYSRTMSFSYCISSKGVIYEATGVGYVPYCDGNLASNRRTIAIEHAGGIPSVPYTKAMYDASIRLNAWLIDSLGIKDFKKHRDVSRSGTACPGKLDTKRIIDGAKKLRANYYKEKDMLTVDTYTIMRRFYLGAPPSKDQIKRNVGKVTCAEMAKRLKNSPAYTAEIKKVAGGKSVKEHLPTKIREVFKG